VLIQEFYPKVVFEFGDSMIFAKSREKILSPSFLGSDDFHGLLRLADFGQPCWLGAVTK
jgi:hypothetical protein